MNLPADEFDPSDDPSEQVGDPVSDAGQRLDKWLWFARVVKSRSLAARLVTDGKVRIAGQKADKPAQTVRVGDVLTITVARRVRVLEVAAPGVRRGPATESQSLYIDRTPQEEASAPLPGVADLGRQAPRGGGRIPGQGRPTKKERRDLNRLNRDPAEDPS